MVKLNLSSYSLYYAKACNKLSGPISTSSCPGNTASFKDMSQRWQAIGNTVSELTGLKFEPNPALEMIAITAQPTGRCIYMVIIILAKT